jgi:hypothetical protein
MARRGQRGAVALAVFAVRVRPAGVKLRRAATGGELPVRWLLAEWPEGADEPVKYWLASLPADAALCVNLR